MASRLRSTSAAVVAQEETLMRIAVLPCQTVPPHQQVPSSCTRRMTSFVFRFVTERDEHLVADAFIQDIEARGTQAHGKSKRMGTCSFDQFGQTVAAQRFQGGPQFHAAGSA
jgi:hypothetical protein